jgi:hypothetical protein
MSPNLATRDRITVRTSTDSGDEIAVSSTRRAKPNGPAPHGDRDGPHVRRQSLPTRRIGRSRLLRRPDSAGFTRALLLLPARIWTGVTRDTDRAGSAHVAVSVGVRGRDERAQIP